MKIKTAILIALAALSNAADAQWIVQNSGFSTPGRGISSISIVDANVVWATAYDTSAAAIPFNQLTMTINGGTTWTPDSVSGTAGLDFINVTALNKDTAWVAMVDNNNGGGAIYQTPDGGVTWNQQISAAFASPGGASDFVYFFDRNNGVCAGDSNTGWWEIYTTTNGGGAWNRVSNANIPANAIGETGNPNVFATVKKTVWFGTSTGRLFKSINMGLTWIVDTSGLTNITELAFKDTLNGIASDGTILRKTSDGGKTWTTVVFTGTLYGTSLCYVPGSAGTYVSTGYGAGNNGSSYSLNDGATWTTVDAVSHDVVAFLNNNTGWSGGFNTNATTGGMFKWSGGSLGVQSLNSGNSNITVYPNPFNYQTNIVIKDKSSDIDASFTLYNVLGMEVRKITGIKANFILEKGTLDAGVYFYRVINNGQLLGNGKIIIN